MKLQSVIDATSYLSWEKAGGIPLVARTLYHLAKNGAEEVFIFINSDAPKESIKSRWKGKVRIKYIVIEDNSETVLSKIISQSAIKERFLYFNGTYILDPRFIAALMSVSEPSLVFAGRDAMKGRKVSAGCLSRELMELWIEKGVQHVITECRPILPEDIEPFLPEIRGPLAAYCFQVKNVEDCDKATWFLIKSQQKHVMDFPAEFIDPFFENRLTYFFCNTPFTPNFITFLGVITAVAVFYLFWNGFFVSGALLMFAVEILDGVDGKLARTKLHYTRIGNYEDLIDYFCENSWYVALGFGLSSIGPEGYSYLFAVLLILSDTFDNIFYTLAGKWYGKSIDLFGPWDGAFRRIAGRRNIYGLMFICGFIIGLPLQTFMVVAIWAAVTAFMHGMRLFQYGRFEKKVCREQFNI